MSFRPAIAFAAVLAAGAALAHTGSQAAPATPASASGSMATASTAAPANAASAANTASAASAAGAASSMAPAMVDAALASGDPEAGQTKAAVCGACHGVDGNSTSPQYPKLASQNAHYIAGQLAKFKSGERASPIMAGFAAPLSPQDMRDIAAYFSQQKIVPGVADEALVDAGQSLFRGGDPEREIPACMSCHGPDGSGNPGAPYPHLAGQHADYVQAVLTAWKNGDVWGKDAHARIMPTIAKRLTTHDIAAVSSYIEGLHTATPETAPSGTASASTPAIPAAPGSP
ncbi:MAG TPA: c-type cytochrome [Rhodanobacteraceae bacterium]|nr:c-type cytochrome [Rhodanobacteraceae bacterium]